MIFLTTFSLKISCFDISHNKKTQTSLVTVIQLAKENLASQNQVNDFHFLWLSD